VPAWSASPSEQRTALVELARAKARLEERWLRLLASGDRSDVAAASAATSTASWLAAETRRHPGAAAADVRLAAALDGDRAATREALARGDIDSDQARVVVTSLRALPAEVVAAEPSVAGRAESALFDLARSHDARSLTRLGRHILHVLDRRKPTDDSASSSSVRSGRPPAPPSSSCTTTATARTAGGCGFRRSTPRC
jgi:hypothetical protein